MPYLCWRKRVCIAITTGATAALAGCMLCYMLILAALQCQGGVKLRNPLKEIPDIHFSDYGCKLEAAHYKAGQSQQWILTLWALNEETHEYWEIPGAGHYLRSDPGAQMKGLKDCHFWMAFVEKKLNIKPAPEKQEKKNAI